MSEEDCGRILAEASWVQDERYLRWIHPLLRRHVPPLRRSIRWMNAWCVVELFAAAVLWVVLLTAPPVDLAARNVLVVFGVFLPFSAASTLLARRFMKRRWLKLMRDGPAYVEPVTVVFREHGIVSRGPTSNGVLRWEGLQALIDAPGALILRLPREQSIIVPDSELRPADSKPALLQHFARRKAASSVLSATAG